MHTRYTFLFHTETTIVPITSKGDANAAQQPQATTSIVRRYTMEKLAISHAIHQSLQMDRMEKLMADCEFICIYIYA